MVEHLVETTMQKLYIQSRGIEQHNDYRWLKIKSDSSCLMEIPPILKRNLEIESGSYTTIPDLIDSQKPSIVLVESDNELLLLVTGLTAREERTDFVGRRVRNSIAWTCTYSSNSQNLESRSSYEKLMRGLAACALREELADQVDKAISIGGEHGFEVSYEAISQLENSLHVEALELDEDACINRISKNSLEHKQELAQELERYSLPLEKCKNRILVLVTTIKSQDALERVCVWRGLSNRVESDEWIEVPHSSASESLGMIGQNEKKNATWLTLGILLILVIAVVSLTILRPWRSNTPIPPQPLPQELQMQTVEETVQITTSEKSLKTSLQTSNLSNLSK